MDLTDALATAERNVLAAFQRCIALPGATRRDLDALAEQLNLYGQPSRQPRLMPGASRCSNLPPAFSATLQRKARSMGEIALVTTRPERPKKKKAVAAVIERNKPPRRVPRYRRLAQKLPRDRRKTLQQPRRDAFRHIRTHTTYEPKNGS